MALNGTDPAQVKVVIAPGISSEFTVVKTSLIDYRAKFPDFDLESYIQETDNPEFVKFDLGAAIKESLIRQGVLERNIEMSGFNTDKNNDLFSSERAEGRENRDSYGFMMVLK